jgi:hypothetical protein
MNEDDCADILCETCKCPGNGECPYPPSPLVDCALDDAGVCPCCRAGIDRMTYRPEDDGQMELK